MSQVTNQISLFKKIDNQLLEKVGYSLEKPIISYLDDTDLEKNILCEHEDRIVLMTELDSLWSPINHNLKVEQVIKITNPSYFFGESGVTSSENKIGFAAHIHSTTSNFQKVINFGSLEYTEKPTDVSFEYNFPKSSIRGVIYIDFLIYLKDYQSGGAFQTDIVGMKLNEGDIGNIIIYVDGDGSIFPITEFEEKDGPLWILEKNWIEPNLDTFDVSNINLSLNIAHPLFAQLKEGKNRVNKRFMGDIIVQAMAYIINDVLFNDGYTVEDFEDAEPNSILAAVAYWITTFEIDISSAFSVSNSLRRYWEYKLF